MRKLFKAELLGAVLLNLVGFVSGIPIPPLRIDTLCNSSDVIVTGVVGPFVKVGTTLVTVGSNTYPADLLEATISVQAVLKGAGIGSTVRFTVPVFSPPGGSVGLDGVPSGLDQLVFLAQDERKGYTVTDPYHPSLPSVTGVQAVGDLPINRVASVECSVITSTSVEPMRRLEAMWSLRHLSDSCIVPSLRDASGQSQIEIKLTAEAELLSKDDTSVLNTAIERILRPDVNIESYLRHNLLVAIRTGIRNPSAISALALLLRGGDKEGRRSAVEALKNIGSSQCIPLLIPVLSDSDREVRYTAVTALADINGVPEMHPSIPTFQQNEAKYISYWQDWASQTRK